MNARKKLQEIAASGLLKIDVMKKPPTHGLDYEAFINLVDDEEELKRRTYLTKNHDETHLDQSFTGNLLWDSSPEQYRLVTDDDSFETVLALF